MKIQVGDQMSLEKIFSQEDVINFSELSEDRNPVHLDTSYAVAQGFSNTIVHGILSAGLLSALIGTKLPGKGAIYLEQNLNFLKPAFINERLRAEVTVLKIRQDKPIITLRTAIFKENNELAIDGSAVVLFREDVNV